MLGCNASSSIEQANDRFKPEPLGGSMTKALGALAFGMLLGVLAGMPYDRMIDIPAMWTSSGGSMVQTAFGTAVFVALTVLCSAAGSLDVSACDSLPAREIPAVRAAGTPGRMNPALFGCQERLTVL
jgi:hypothetical protein